MSTDRPGFFTPETMLPRVFFWSGVASLFFQVAWQRLLTLYYGVGSVSITLIVSIYMIGLGLGAFIGGFIADSSRHRLRIYMIVEITLALFGACSLTFLQLLGKHTASGGISVAMVSMCAFLCLPTILMGTTLPLVIKLFDKPEDNNFLRSISLLYSINTLGATVGCLLCSFVVISFLGLDFAVYIASAIDAVLALLIFSIRKHATGNESQLPDEQVKPALRRIFGSYIYSAILVTGFLAIGYEIVWFRFMQVLLKSSPYSFSMILATYLAGIGLGSYVMNAVLERRPQLDRRSMFFLLQVLTGIYVLFSVSFYVFINRHTDFRCVTAISFTHGQALRPEETSMLQHCIAKYPMLPEVAVWSAFIWPLLFVFPPTILMGGTFPLLSYLVLPDRQQQGRTVGTLYFMNTVGNVLGGLITGFVLVANLGTEFTMLLFELIGIAMIFFVSRIGKFELSLPLRGAIFAGAVLCSLLVFPHRNALWYTIHMSAVTNEERKRFNTFSAEGEDAIVFTVDDGEYLRNVINGMTHGSRGAHYMFQRETIEALSCVPAPGDVLVIGFGAGATVETLLKDERIGKITLIEICHTNLTNLKKIDRVKRLLEDPRVEVIIDDGRRFLQSDRQRYDLILLDPLRTQEAYSNNIYSKQFMQLLREHIKPAGMVLFWLDNFDVLPNTVAAVFPHVQVFNYFCLASEQVPVFDPHVRDALAARFPAAEAKNIMGKPTFLLFDETTRANHVKTDQINEDWRPVTEYALGRRLVR